MFKLEKRFIFILFNYKEQFKTLGGKNIKFKGVKVYIKFYVKYVIFLLLKKNLDLFMIINEGKCFKVFVIMKLDFFLIIKNQQFDNNIKG